MPAPGASARDRTIGVMWCLAVVVLLAALVVGAVRVVSDWSAEQGFRWVMAVLFLGGSLLWLTAYHQDALRRFFDRPPR